MTLNLILPLGISFEGYNFLIILDGLDFHTHTYFSPGILLHFLLALDSDLTTRLEQGICYNLLSYKAGRVWESACDVL